MSLVDESMPSSPFEWGVDEEEQYKLNANLEIYLSIQPDNLGWHWEVEIYGFAPDKEGGEFRSAEGIAPTADLARVTAEQTLVPLLTSTPGEENVSDR